MSGIADLRNYRGVSVDELAAKLGVSVDTLEAFEELTADDSSFMQQYLHALTSGIEVFPVPVPLEFPDALMALDVSPISPAYRDLPARVVTLRGELGSGKTHLLKKVATAAKMQNVPTVGLLGNNEWLDSSLFSFSQEVSKDSDLKNIWKRWDSRLVKEFGKGIVFIDGVPDDAVSNMIRYGRSFDVMLPLVRTEVETVKSSDPDILKTVECLTNFSN